MPGKTDARARQADHEFRYAHAEQAGSQIVAAFVDEDEHRKDYRQAQYHDEYVHTSSQNHRA